MTLPQGLLVRSRRSPQFAGLGDTLRHNGESWHTAKCQAFHSTQIGHFAVPFIP
jgi:hypothetical protein